MSEPEMQTEKTTRAAKMGRPSVLDEFKRQQLCGLVTAGSSIALAAQYVGVSPRTVQYAIKHDSEFREQVGRARAACELVPLGKLRVAANDSWRAAAWYLERMRPARYRPRPTKPLPTDDAVRLVNRLIRSICDEFEDVEIRNRVFAVGKRARASIKQTNTRQPRESVYEDVITEIIEDGERY